MIILSQVQDRIINFEQIKFIERDETAIFANVGAEEKYGFICLGNYTTWERAEQVLKEILDWIADKDGEDCKIFYMPKE